VYVCVYVGFSCHLELFLRMMVSVGEEVGRHVTMETAASSCKTFSKETYGDTTFTQKTQLMDDLVVFLLYQTK
jgi:hypothetical protein